MNAFYKRHLASLARMAGRNLTPIWPAAALVYPLLATGVVFFVVARARSPIEALVSGAVLCGSTAWITATLARAA